MTHPVEFLRRRHFVKLVGAAGLGLATTTACSQAPTTQTASAPTPAASPAAQTTATNAAVEQRSNEMTPDEALKMLVDGNKRFVEGKAANPRHSFARVQDTAVDEFPFAAVLCSSDSRVSPEIVFDQGVGDLYVSRVFGFVATPEVVETMEFAAGALKVPLIMVLGSAREPAVQAVLRDQSSVLAKMTRLAPAIEPAVEPHRGKVDGSDLSAAIKENMKVQAARLKQSEVLSAAVQAGSLKILTAYYDIDSATVELEEA